MNTSLKNWLWKQSYFLLFSICIIVLFPTTINGQCFFDTNLNKYVTATGESCVNTIITAVPFLRIVPNARSASMGDAGLATSADADAMHFNESKLVFAENKWGLSLTYTQWLRALEVSDVYLGYAAGYYQLNEKNALGLSFKYFSLGEIAFTDQNGMPLGTGRPNEYEFKMAYAIKFGNHFSGGLGVKYIYSNLAAGQQVGGEQINAGTSKALDLSFTYQIPSLTIGLALTNLGQKITYTNSVNKDFIPTNFGLGIAWNKTFGNQHRITLTTDVNKLMIPTPDPICEDKDSDRICDYKQKGYFSSVFGSFGDAPEGFKEEIRELMFSFGAEFWLKDFIVFRTGYFTEHATKGNRKYFTTGLGYKYKFVTLNGSYLIPTTNQRNPLDNTFRISLLFNFGVLKNTENS